MHELSLCRSIAAIAERSSAGRPVLSIQLDVGQLRQVVPETLVYCWGIVCENSSSLAGSRLEVTSIPAIVTCRECTTDSTIEGVPILVCASCGSGSVVVRSGEEFLVRSMEVGEKEGKTDGSLSPPR
ncbi:hydrogenase maturation nickel metallochaperone HypA [Microbacterium sp. NPDC076895]|uniref:hydrogenase maturation nickel metallochaperone HypA n=1 Tax=Microbacterium sp. NPDC076895 TaxID=3154957 RepID=UPI0034445A1F